MSLNDTFYVYKLYYYINIYIYMIDNNNFIINKALIQTIESLYKNLKIFKEMYSNEYNNIYSIDLFDKYSLENLNLLINIRNFKLVKKNLLVFNQTINIIRNNLNIIIIIIHANFLYQSSVSNNYNYNDYIELFKNLNIENTFNQGIVDMQTKIKVIKILGDNFIFKNKIIDQELNINEGIILMSVDTISESIDNILNLLENFIFIIGSINKNKKEKKNISNYVNKYSNKKEKNNISNYVNKYSNKKEKNNISNCVNKYSNKKKNILISKKLFKITFYDYFKKILIFLLAIKILIFNKNIVKKNE